MKLGTVGSIETLLIVVPAGKAVTAVGGKVGLGGLATASVRKAMATDILLGFGETATQKLAASRVGQGFMRAYAKVYNSKYNKAIVGTTKQEIKVGGTGAAAATPDEAAIAQARQRATNTKRVGSNIPAAPAGRPAQRIYRTFDDFRAGRNFADVDEALKGWEVYQRAAKSNGLIIGKTKEITTFAGQEGRDVLYFYRRATDGTELARSGWTWEINKAWLDGAIDQGLTVRLLTPATEIARSGALWREFNYLLSKGLHIRRSCSEGHQVFKEFP